MWRVRRRDEILIFESPVAIAPRDTRRPTSMERPDAIRAETDYVFATQPWMGGKPLNGKHGAAGLHPSRIHQSGIEAAGLACIASLVPHMARRTRSGSVGEERADEALYRRNEHGRAWQGNSRRGDCVASD